MRQTSGFQSFADHYGQELHARFNTWWITRRNLNLRFLAYLLGAVVVLGGAGYGLHAWQLNRNAHALVEQANLEKEAGLLLEATKSYRRYLQLVPNDGDALADYGLALDQLAKTRHDREAAFFALDKG